MISNREITGLFNLYAELLLLHQDEHLSALLSGALYTTRTYYGVRSAPHRLQAVGHLLDCTFALLSGV